MDTVNYWEERARAAEELLAAERQRNAELVEALETVLVAVNQLANVAGIALAKNGDKP